MEEKLVLQILELLQTMQEACQELYTSAEIQEVSCFMHLCGDMELGLAKILEMVKEEGAAGNPGLCAACKSSLNSLRRVKEHFLLNWEVCLRKIEFELLPLLQEAYAMYYLFQYLSKHPEHLPEYNAKEKNQLFGNEYIDEALKTGHFQYEVSIFVVGYNKLDYTKICVENLLKNLPANLNYELILVNHGSSDGTKEYFESICPHKQVDIAVNGGGAGVVSRIFEGEFLIGISNDVVVTPNAIENMLSCIRSSPDIAWVVPATPNVSNLQSIPAEYSSLEELTEFALQNNRLDPFRWEQRVRLCNPIDLKRASVFYSSAGLCTNGVFHSSSPVYASSFPDDRISLFLRRNGYKMMLVKDAYCHHFGSVTLKTEIQQYNEQKYYREGREAFQTAFGVDPWGDGFCYDPVFENRVVDSDLGHVEVLGINCGLGSNALKIKEQIKEYCRNTDCCLHFFTDDERYLYDLRGIGEGAEVISSIKRLKSALHGRTFQYIIWETPFLRQYKLETLLQCCRKSLAFGGKLFLKRNDQNELMIEKKELSVKTIGNGWFLLSWEDQE